MSQRADQDNLTVLLARAFDRAWNRYYLPDRKGTAPEEIARNLLAKHLVAMVKDGVMDEATLAESGLLHLNSLMPAELHRAMPGEAVSEPPALVHERQQPSPLSGLASRFALAIGISAIIASVFFVVAPKSQKSDATELAVPEHRSPQSAGAAAMPAKESRALLEKFLLWKATGTGRE